METEITKQIQEIEKSYRERREKPLLFDADMLTLKQQVRDYCKEKGYYTERII